MVLPSLILQITMRSVHMKHHIGFIGSGNMGLAIIQGIIASHIVEPEQITVFDIVEDKLKDLHETTKLHIAHSEEEVAEKSNIIFLAVKPNIVPAVLEKIKAHLSKSSLIVSIAAGVTIEAIEASMGRDHKIVRVMPNTPALVNEGMTSITVNKHVTRQEFAQIATIFDSLGRSEEIPESLIHAVTGISGSSPAYVFIFIEAMADAAVLAGMPRDKAYKFAAQAVLGSAKMVLKSGKHPGELKDMVCSPGGTTIEAVKVLEDTGFRASVMGAVTACVDKSKYMSGE